MVKNPFLVFGEVVFDLFPEAKRMGGAPLNFAYYLKKAGFENIYLISAFGNDEFGQQIKGEIKAMGLDIHGISTNHRPTGTVEIRKSGKQHSFRIVRSSAWEELVYESVNRPTGLYLGSLTRISGHNRRISNRYLEVVKGGLVCVDVNIRKSYQSATDLDFLLSKATHVKMNEGESTLLHRYGLLTGKTHRERAERLFERYPNVVACCITIGARGAIGCNHGELAIKAESFKALPGGDAVGAGDAFFAYWVAALLKGKSMIEALSSGCRIGAAVASIPGALLRNDSLVV